MKIISVVGARPNFMKIAPLIHAIITHNKEEKSPILDHLLVHTGQHYDDRMSEAFFKALKIPKADINLGIGSGSHAEQVGKTMIAFEKVLLREKPDWVIVLGDINATLACSVTAKKLHIKTCHIEAGLRSGDISMPEEINRLVTDRISDLLLTPDELSNKNLLKEGIEEKNIIFVGNIMIDTLEANRTAAKNINIDTILKENQIEGQSINLDRIPRQYALVTMHRPSNVDSSTTLSSILHFLIHEVGSNMPLIWPIHPRTYNRLKACGLLDKAIASEQLLLLHPIGYHEMLRLNMTAKIMLTDSGGLQEECTVLGTPCLTLRCNTERPITLREHGGASVLVGNNIERIRKEYLNTIKVARTPECPPLWDGNTAQRCLKAILEAE
jgi:UDP-N-acetylglucosamine 2-epimerase (non-hydrolysing)